ncbi:trypsin-like peptidase domain-containing protein [Candidatus Uhrbacteria bacterium]|nr:trypsin-like peptidase domain-containing protein [Candidatus Uhrbacteria bacterium]
MMKSKCSHLSLIVLVSLLAGVLGGALGSAVSPAFRLSFVPSATSGTSAVLTPPSPVPANGFATAEDDQLIAVLDRVLPAVVSIAATIDASKLPSRRSVNPFFGEEFPLGESEPAPEGRQKIGGGSGFLVSAGGLIVTNRHVVEDPNAQYEVLLRNGTSLSATVLARDPVLDLAILDIEGDNYPYLTFADSDALKTGQTVVAIGNALDEFRNTVTKGIVSGLNRRIIAENDFDGELIEEAIQTDAAINRGNSGGPLIDLQGRVVGVNTAVSFAGQLLGFALPSNLVKRDVEQVQKLGRIARPFLGIRYLIITDDLVKKNNLPVDHGVLISRGAEPSDLAVIPGSPADKEGISENDIILSLDGTPINDEHSLSSLISRHIPGDTVALRILRRGEEKDVRVTLDEFKPQK